MKYKYTYRMTSTELWQLSMYYTYGSMVGVCNVIFTVAVLALMISRWSLSGGMMKLLMVTGLCLFTIIQPLAVYVRAKQQVSGITRDTHVWFSDQGIHVTVGNQSSDVSWNTVKKISKKPTMIVMFADTTHGFVLTNRILGQEREDFYQFVLSKIKHN